MSIALCPNSISIVSPLYCLVFECCPILLHLVGQLLLCNGSKKCYIPPLGRQVCFLTICNRIFRCDLISWVFTNISTPMNRWSSHKRLPPLLHTRIDQNQKGWRRPWRDQIPKYDDLKCPRPTGLTFKLHCRVPVRYVVCGYVAPFPLSCGSLLAHAFM